MTTRRAPSAATRRSRTAAVSATLRRAGYRPTPSGSTLQGLIKVTSGFDLVSIVIDTSIHPRSVSDRLVRDLTELLIGKGYRIDRVNRSDEAQAVWVYVEREGWR